MREAQGGAFESRGQFFIRITVGPQQRIPKRAPWAKTLEQAKARAVIIQGLVQRLRASGKAELLNVDFEKFVKRGAEADEEKLAAIVKMVDGMVAGDIVKRKPQGERSIAKQAETWIGSVGSLYDSRTVSSLRQYSAHWPAALAHDVDAIDGAVLARFMADRLGKVTRSTVKKELWALRAFFVWSVDVAKTIDAVPPFPKLPRRALGVRSGKHREKPVELTRENVEALLSALDELTVPLPEGAPAPPGRPRTEERRKAFYRYAVMAETGLRPETLDLLSVPEHFTKGAATLNITADIDKNRWARELPLSERAREILDGVAPKRGPIFGRKRWIEVFKEAVAKAKLPPETAPYDLRHAMGTHGVEASGGNLTGVAYLLGHKQVTTTNRYVHSNQRSAETVLAALAQTSTEPQPPAPPAPSTGGASDAADAAAKVRERPRSGAQPRVSTRAISTNSRSGSGGVTPVRVQLPSFAPPAESLEKVVVQNARIDAPNEDLQPRPQPRRGSKVAADGDAAAEVDPVEAALAGALTSAAAAGRFDVVAQLARELEARRLAGTSNVVRIGSKRQGRG